MRFIAAHKERWGIEPICRVLRVAPSTYYARTTRPAAARTVRDRELQAAVGRVWAESRRVYGADKVWAQLNRTGTPVARCTVERLMCAQGLRGVVRGRTVRTTRGHEASSRPADLVARRFRAAAPNRLWVADLTYVRTFAGWVYAAFVVDVFSRVVVGWQVSRSLSAELALDALEMALWARRAKRLDGLVHHSDRGGQGGFNRSSQRLREEELWWASARGGVPLGQGGRRCGRRVDPGSRGGGSGNASGRASPGA